MLYSVLAVGDVVGESGLAHLERHLRPLQKLKNISFRRCGSMTPGPMP